MSEVMTTEAIIEAYWLLDGYWTKPRFAFKTEKGAWSDVDVLAYHPGKKHLVIAESKAQGPKGRVYAYTGETKKSFCETAPRYVAFLDHLPSLCKELCKKKKSEKYKQTVDFVTVQLVCNYAIEERIKKDVLKEMNCVLKKKIGARVGKKTPEFQLDSAIEIIGRLFEKERESGQGRRYGNPVLDFVREINRYIHPSMKGAGHTSRAIQYEMIQGFINALALPETNI